MKFGNEYCDGCGQSARQCECVSTLQAAYNAAVEEEQRAAEAALAKRVRSREALNDLERAKRKAAEAIPVDRSQQTLTDGSPVTPDHRDIKPNGQQKAYVVLSEAERARGFVRPVRRTYVHQTCGVATTMGQALAETYARDPKFYSGTFCVGCGTHFPVGENGQFVWDDGTKVGT